MKNSKAVWLLLIANTISGIAQGMSMIAIPWSFVQRDESRLLMVVYGTITLLSLFWGPVAGTLIDKYNRKKVFLVLMATLGVLLLAISSYGFSQPLPWGAVAAVFGLTYLNYHLHYPNLYAFLQEIVEEEHHARVMSMIEVQGQTAFMLAGFGSALLLEGAPEGLLHIGLFDVRLPFTYAPWQLHQIFMLDAITYFIGIGLIWFVRYVPLAKREGETGNFITRLRVGIAFARQSPRVFVFGTVSYIPYTVSIIAGFSLFAMYVSAHLKASADVYAAGEFTYSAGALVAGMAVNYLLRTLSLLTRVVLLTLLSAAAYFALVVTNGAGWYLFISILFGVTNAGIRILRMTYLFAHIPNQLFGRVSGLLDTVIILYRLFFIALLTLPFFHQSNHVIYAFAMFAILLVIACVVLYWNDRRTLK